MMRRIQLCVQLADWHLAANQQKMMMVHSGIVNKLMMASLAQLGLMKKCQHLDLMLMIHLAVLLMNYFVAVNNQLLKM